MRNFKLTIDLLPKGAWENDLSKTLSKKDWDTLRNKCYERANYRCVICGAKPDKLNAHEVWDFDIRSKTQTLKDIVALCSKCHSVKHFRNSERLGYGANAKNHFIKINNCTELEFASHLAEAKSIFDERNSIYYWNMVTNLDKFGGQGIKFNKNTRPRIENPYTESELEDLQNEVKLLPRILSLDVNNYNGNITIKCDRTNKIIWYSGNKILQTKFNFSHQFITSFSVKEINYDSIYFKLIGNGGEYISKTFKLTKFFIDLTD